MNTPESSPAMVAVNAQSVIVANSTGWLGSAEYEHPDKRKMGRAMSASLVAHGGLLLALIAVFGIKPAVNFIQDEVRPKFVFLQDPGPGGGGGGSPATAPPKHLEVPQHQAAPTPVEVVELPPPPPIPTLNAPVETNAASVLQASGVNSISLADYGGGGRGGGIGKGTGNGVGEGTGGGFGGGAFMPGNGVTNPEVIRQVDPDYTSDAMRQKIQGEVELEAVVMPNGTISDVRVVSSLDAKYGLDDQAMKAARQWLFRPGMKDGEKVPVLIRLILTFRLH